MISLWKLSCGNIWLMSWYLKEQMTANLPVKDKLDSWTDVTLFEDFFIPSKYCISQHDTKSKQGCRFQCQLSRCQKVFVQQKNKNKIQQIHLFCFVFSKMKCSLLCSLKTATSKCIKSWCLLDKLQNTFFSRI